MTTVQSLEALVDVHELETAGFMYGTELFPPMSLILPPRLLVTDDNLAYRALAQAPLSTPLRTITVLYEIGLLAASGHYLPDSLKSIINAAEQVYSYHRTLHCIGGWHSDMIEYAEPDRDSSSDLRTSNISARYWRDISAIAPTPYISSALPSSSKHSFMTNIPPSGYVVPVPYEGTYRIFEPRSGLPLATVQSEAVAVGEWAAAGLQLGPFPDVAPVGFSRRIDTPGLSAVMTLSGRRRPLWIGARFWPDHVNPSIGHYGRPQPGGPPSSREATQPSQP